MQPLSIAGWCIFMPIPQLEKTLTALAGEFAVESKLSLKGYVASLTLKNFLKVGTFCLNPKNGKQVPIQVKTKKVGGSII
jgi:hypothetical protein